MILKQQYIQMRNSGQVHADWFYRYFVDQGGKSTPENFFDNFFYIIHKMEVPGGFMESREERDIRPVIEHLDKKFDLTLLFSKTGEFLKIVQ